MKISTRLNYFVKNCLYRRRALKLIKSRSKLSVFDFEQSSAGIPLRYYFAYTRELDKFNDFYAIAAVLKKYAGLSEDSALSYHVEHGVFFDQSSYHGELYSPFSQIIVPADFRVEVLAKRYHKKAVPIGPYIYYTKSFFPKSQTQKIRKKSGKTLTAFPVHSTESVGYRYDSAKYCRELLALKRAHRFKTLRVCLFYKDILKGIHLEYQKHGIEVVSAGHMFDPQFLPRLRSIIELSDVTCANALGTQLAYSLQLGKPHFIKTQELSCDDLAKEISQESWDAYYSDSDILRAFSTYREKISRSQFKLMDRYCGFSHVLTPVELKKLLGGSR